MKNKLLALLTFLLVCFLVGCQQNADELPSSIITPELAQNFDKDSFLSKINDLVSSGDVQNQIAEPLGDVRLENLSYFNSVFKENVAFVPVYRESSVQTEAVIIATQSSNGIKLGIIRRGHLRALIPLTRKENTPGLTMLAQLFTFFDDRIFDHSTNDFTDIIGAKANNSSANSRSAAFEGSNIVMGWIQVQDGVICVDTFKEGEPEGTLDCWPDYHWEYSASEPIIIDWNPGGAGSDGTYTPSTDPKKPCVGNAIKNPEIAPQKWSKIEGARYGETARNEWNKDRTALIPKPHYGLDIKNSFGDPVYSMFDGTIIETDFDENGWGKWIRVKSIVNGKTVIVHYAHLDSYAKTSGTVSAGTILGKAGKTGNLAGAIKRGTAVQHTHIETREGNTWDTAAKKNPEEYITTKFDSTGKAIESTKC